MRKFLWPTLLCMLLTFSCTGKKTSTDTDVTVDTAVDSDSIQMVIEDTLEQLITETPMPRAADAYFDDLMIYNRELSADDVAGLNTLLNRVNNFDTNIADGITEIAVDESAASVPAYKQGIYDLMGRRVAVPGKGFYIVNGKKVLFK